MADSSDSSSKNTTAAAAAAGTSTPEREVTVAEVANQDVDDDDEVVLDFPPFIKVYKSGRFIRYTTWTWVPPSLDPEQPVLSKDVLITSETGLSARLFLPKEAHQPNDNKKSSSLFGKKPPRRLPLLIYFHGGAYVIESAFSSTFHAFVNTLVAESKVVALSVDYRIAPEHPIGDCYNDSWKAVRWALSHSTGRGPEHWLNQHVDFNKVFFAGDSAGGNISSNMAWRAGVGAEVEVSGIALIHPFFGLDDQPNAIWDLFCPDSTGITDPRLNPIVHPEVLEKLGCKKALVCVAEKDEFGLRERGVSYYEALKKSGWKGQAELFESLGEGHDFQLFHPDTERARELRNKINDFLNGR